RTTTVVLLSSFFTCPPAPHHLPSSPTRRSSDLVVAEGPLTAGGSQRPPPAALQPGLQLAGYLGLRLPALLPILWRHRTACQRRLLQLGAQRRPGVGGRHGLPLPVQAGAPLPLGQRALDGAQAPIELTGRGPRQRPQRFEFLPQGGQPLSQLLWF